MEPPRLTEEQRREIEARKRAVWAQCGAGKHYHHLAHRKDPITRLKNLTEIGFVLRHVSGPRVLDAGAGTGRFTFSLQEAGYETTALDISHDMLLQGREHGASTGRGFPCVRGEIGRLPFEDGMFDSVVSMTVLRHFPQWSPLLDEYVRVTRSGGRIIFDMASGEQQKYGDSIGLPRSHIREGFQPLDFDAGVTLEEMLAYANDRELGISACQPHDFFNGNPLLDHVLGEGKEAFVEEVGQYLSRDEVVRFCEMAHRRFLPALNPAVCGSVLFVLEKGACGELLRPCLPDPADEAFSRCETVLLSVLKQSLGRKYGSFMREASKHAESRIVKEFVAFCRDRLLSRWPTESLVWQDPQTRA